MSLLPTKKGNHKMFLKPTLSNKPRNLSNTTHLFSELMIGYSTQVKKINKPNDSIIKIIMEEKSNLTKERRQQGLEKAENSLDEIVNDDKTKKTVNKLTFSNNIFERNSPKKPNNPLPLEKNSNYLLLIRNLDSSTKVSEQKNMGETQKMLRSGSTDTLFLPKLDSTLYSFRNTNVNFLNKLDETIHSNTNFKKDVSKIFFGLARSISQINRKIDLKSLESNINKEYTDSLRNTILQNSTKSTLNLLVNLKDYNLLG